MSTQSSSSATGGDGERYPDYFDAVAVPMRWNLMGIFGGGWFTKNIYFLDTYIKRNPAMCQVLSELYQECTTADLTGAIGESQTDVWSDPVVHSCIIGVLNAANVWKVKDLNTRTVISSNINHRSAINICNAKGKEKGRRAAALEYSKPCSILCEIKYKHYKECVCKGKIRGGYCNVHIRDYASCLFN